ncbi:MAG: DNA (cytosine-5-)-methyltransferase, partial [Pseudomonadota bacterium]
MLTEFADLRDRTGMTMAATAEFLGVSPRTVQRYVRGDTRPRPRELQAMKGLAAATWLPIPVTESSDNFRFVDLFAGIGGLRVGFEEIGGKCVFTSEWDKFAQQTYRANFPNDDHEIAGDITAICEEDIPAHDLLLAGFPCQPFSIAGVSKKNALNRPHGFADKTQGTLFFDVARILAFHQPKAFVLENVRNLASHDRGRTLRLIMHTLTNELGYNVETKIIDAKPWVPQHRERIFLV